MENLKEVTSKDLIPGKLYSDMRTFKHGMFTILEFVKKDEFTLYFRYDMGSKSYLGTEEGTIPFHLGTDACFYELTDEHIDYLKQIV